MFGRSSDVVGGGPAGKSSNRRYYVAFSPENPLSENELREKFLELAAMVLSSGRAQKLFDAIQDIEQLRDTGELAQLLTPIRDSI